jgi:hypothetical protein
VLLVLALVCAPVGLILLATTSRTAWAESRKVETRGAVVDARVVLDPHPPARRAGPWLKEWEVEFDAGAGPVRRWFPVRHYRTERGTIAGSDTGKAVSVWHRPGSSADATLDRPAVLRNMLWAGWSAVVGVVGVLGVWALVRSGMRAVA